MAFQCAFFQLIFSVLDKKKIFDFELKSLLMVHTMMYFKTFFWLWCMMYTEVNTTWLLLLRQLSCYLISDTHLTYIQAGKTIIIIKFRILNKFGFLETKEIFQKISKMDISNSWCILYLIKIKMRLWSIIGPHNIQSLVWFL